ncbi:MAG: hypothetical protein KJO07_05110 [Deltaproteobacteria bacterium]|nr:hypothetical protein [Deltaproteobacteria bacterium]
MRTILVMALTCLGCQSGGGEGAKTPKTPTAKSASARVAAQPALPVADLEGKKVASIEVGGLERVAPKAARQWLETRLGDKVDRDQLAADAGRLWASGQFDDVRVEGRQTEAGVAIRFVCRERPLVDGVEVTSTFPRDKVAPAMALRSGMVLSWDKLEATRAAILGLYDAQGITGSTIETNLVDKPNNRVKVFLTVKPGVRHTLGALRFVGNKVATDAELTKLVGAKPGGVVHEDTIDRSAQVITAYYYDRGYINVKVEGAHDSKSRVVTFTIVEDKQFRLGAIKVTGKLARPKAQYLKLIKSKPGRIFNRSKLGEDIKRLTEFHQGLGFPKAYVTPLTNVDLGKQRVAIEFQIDQ